MKSLLLAAAAATLLLATGCSYSRADAPAHEPVPAAIYKAGHGLQLSPAAREFAGITTAEFDGRLPAAALLRTARGDFVFVVNGDWFLRTPVTVAAGNGPTYTLTNGLYEGDIVVTQGGSSLWLAEIQAVNGGVGCTDGH